MTNPKTIITYLVDGNPQWIKTVELSNRVGKAISIPRAQLKEAKKRAECNQPALYFLFWKDLDQDLAYIGEAENLIQRLSHHDTNKDFREVVIAFVSKDNNLTKADVKFLEAEAIQKAQSVNRYSLQNGTTPSVNNLPEYQESTMREFLANIDLLIAAMWYPILKEVSVISSEVNNIYYLSSRGAEAKWEYTEEGMVILKWSKWPKDLQSSVIEKKHYAYRHRPSLLKKWVISEEWECIVFKQDYVFSSPSSAASFIAGASLNWWIVWKDKDWVTLDENERISLDNN